MFDKGQFEVESWLKLLDRGRAFQASNSRDKIYGLTGHPLVNSGEDDGILGLSPKYDDSIPNVYADVTGRHIEKSSTLDNLSQAGHGEGMRSSKLPSWIPLWIDRTGRIR